MQAGEKVVHRPERKVLPTERVERTAQTGPRPAFQQTYLEQLSALWPEEPEPPVTRIEYQERSRGAEPRAAEQEPVRESAPERAMTTPSDTAEPTVDIRR
jgi:hypothetical protein